MFYLVNRKKYIEKSLAQLWDEDHKTFYYWIIGFIVSLFLIVSIYLSAIIIYSLDKDSIIDYFKQIALEDKKTSPIDAANYSYMAFLIPKIVAFVVLSISLASLIFSFIKGIKAKSFAVISYSSTFLIFLLTIYSFIDLIFYPIQNYDIRKTFNISNSFIIFFALNFIYLFVYFFASRNVAQIRLIFIRAQIIESNKMMFNQQNSGVDSIFSELNTTNFNKSDISNQSIKENDATFERLNALSKEQLNEIAQKLSISGYESMKKQELVKTIASIYNVMYQNSNEIEVDSLDLNNEDDKISNN